MDICSKGCLSRFIRLKPHVSNRRSRKMRNRSLCYDVGFSLKVGLFLTPYSKVCLRQITKKSLGHYWPSNCPVHRLNRKIARSNFYLLFVIYKRRHHLTNPLLVPLRLMTSFINAALQFFVNTNFFISVINHIVRYRKSTLQKLNKIPIYASILKYIFQK